MSKCELLEKGCDCQPTEIAKCQQRERIEYMMQQDEKDRIYQASEKRPLEEFFSFMESRQYFIGNDLFQKYKELTDKKPMKSREEIEAEIESLEANDRDLLRDSILIRQSTIEALK